MASTNNCCFSMARCSFVRECISPCEYQEMVESNRPYSARTPIRGKTTVTTMMLRKINFWRSSSSERLRWRRMLSLADSMRCVSERLNSSKVSAVVCARLCLVLDEKPRSRRILAPRIDGLSRRPTSYQGPPER
ncbi:hypothetical protein TPAR_02110 [Tolypocladium paradoxum]|uniref:Uncharacterized protein n=1 Tax=Tolypocladium paradoxum TaxID=94208 RepID=A0A2S4L5I8_9HYPO|nr:hypothetical protein TPAR_02110 [Tolypocladium paradoxum]